MPHNLFLHSALVHSRPVEGGPNPGSRSPSGTAAKKVGAGWARLCLAGRVHALPLLLLLLALPACPKRRLPPHTPHSCTPFVSVALFFAGERPVLQH